MVFYRIWPLSLLALLLTVSMVNAYAFNLVESDFAEERYVILYACDMDMEFQRLYNGAFDERLLLCMADWMTATVHKEAINLANALGLTKQSVEPDVEEVESGSGCSFVDPQEGFVDGWNYQEFARYLSDDECMYVDDWYSNGEAYPTYPVERFQDGDIATETFRNTGLPAGTFLEVFVNYTKPLYSTNASLWQVYEYPSVSDNLSLADNGCWDADSEVIQFRVRSFADPQRSRWYCRNATDWFNFTVSDPDIWLYEEGMYWYINTSGG